MMNTRHEDYRQLSSMLAAFKRLRDPHIEHRDLFRLRIQISPLDIDPEAIDLEKRFCSPFPADPFDRLYDKLLTSDECPEWIQYHPDEDNYGLGDQLEHILCGFLGPRYDPESLVASSKWAVHVGSTKYYKILCENGQEPGRRWQMTSRLDPVSPAVVQRGCTLVDGAVGNDQLLRRSEVICAANLIMERMRLKAYQRHKIIPVFVYSISGRKARILQAYFHGKYLVIRMTKYLDFKERNEDNIKLYLRWMMNEPLGDTMFGKMNVSTHGQVDENVQSVLGRQWPVAVTS